MLNDMKVLECPINTHSPSLTVLNYNGAEFHVYRPIRPQGHLVKVPNKNKSTDLSPQGTQENSTGRFTVGMKSNF